MAVITIYICDKCGEEQPKSDQFWTVCVKASISGCGDDFVKDKHMQVCRPCLESFGIHVQVKPKDKDNHPAIPSVEDLIRELVQRCI